MTDDIAKKNKLKEFLGCAKAKSLGGIKASARYAGANRWYVFAVVVSVSALGLYAYEERQNRLQAQCHAYISYLSQLEVHPSHFIGMDSDIGFSRSLPVQLLLKMDSKHSAYCRIAVDEAEVRRDIERRSKEIKREIERKSKEMKSKPDTKETVPDWMSNPAPKP